MRPKMMRSALPLLLTAWMVASGCVGQLNGDDETAGGLRGDDELIPQSEAPVDDGRQLYFYYGPMKLQPAESILYTLEQITGHDFGAWDYTAPDPGLAIFDAVGNRDGEFYDYCRLLGGCMEHRIPLGRTSFVGTGYVLQLEKAVADACYDLDTFGMFPGEQPPGEEVDEATIISIIEHQYLKAFASEPTATDLQRSIAYFEGQIADKGTEDRTPGNNDLEIAGRGHCRAILASNRFLFY